MWLSTFVLISLEAFKITNFIEMSKVLIFKVVFLAAIEYNREDTNEDQASVEGTEKKPVDVIHSDRKEERKMTTNEESEEYGASKLDRNVEAAWTNKTTPGEEKEHISCVSWYKIFCFLGKTEN